MLRSFALLGSVHHRPDRVALEKLRDLLRHGLVEQGLVSRRELPVADLLAAGDLLRQVELEVVRQPVPAGVQPAVVHLHEVRPVA